MLEKLLAYAAAMVPEVTDRPELIDLAMQRGFNWKRGPFAMMAELGGEPAPAAVRRPGVVLLDDLRGRPAIDANAGASLWDAGDGVACLEFHTKINALDDDLLEMIERTVAAAGERYAALVVYNEGDFFSTGGNLAHLLTLANVAAWDRMNRFGVRGQRAFDGLKFAPVPVVGAPAGRCLGGGCEVLLHCDAVQAHTETYMGLVEVGVGLLPAWGGCRELLIRATESSAGGPMPAAVKAFEMIATARVSTSAQNAKELGYLRPTDRITPNRDRLLADAKAFALELADGYVPPEPRDAHGRRAERPCDPRADRAPARGEPRRERVRPAAGRRVRPGADRRRRRPDRAGARVRDLRARARGHRRAAAPAADDRPDQPHARDRKAAEELMQAYSAPLADFRFLLEEVFDYRGQVAALPGYEDATLDDRAGGARRGGRLRRVGAAAAERAAATARAASFDDGARDHAQPASSDAHAKLVEGGWCGRGDPEPSTAARACPRC